MEPFRHRSKKSAAELRTRLTEALLAEGNRLRAGPSHSAQASFESLCRRRTEGEDDESNIEGNDNSNDEEIACVPTTPQAAGSDSAEMAFASETDCGDIGTSPCRGEPYQMELQDAYWA